MKNNADNGIHMYRGINMITCSDICCYVLRCIGGDVLIDTGISAFRDEIETWLLNYDIKLIVLTSGRYDCIGNAAYFSELYNAPVAMGKYDVPLIKDNLCRKFYNTDPLAHLSVLKAKKAMSIPAERFTPDILLNGGERLCDLGADGVYLKSEVIALDGYTRGSIGILDGKTLYCGNAASGLHSFRWPMFCESPRAAKASLERIVSLSPERIFFGKGKPMFFTPDSRNFRY